jgi:hypothetical protein
MSRKYELGKILNAYEKIINEDHMEMELPPPPSEDKLDITPVSIPSINSKVGHECSKSSEESNLDMAKSELFSILKDGSDLLDLLGNSPEVSPWMLSKLSRACDYIDSVKKVIEYSNFENFCSQEDENDLNNSLRVAYDIKNMLGGEGLAVNEEVLKNVIFNIECLKESNKN